MTSLRRMGRTEAVRAAIYDLSLALDPHRQGVCWPDTIAWDGRPLDEQARDLLALVDDDSPPEVVAAATALEDAMAGGAS